MNQILSFLSNSWVEFLGAAIALVVGVATNALAELIAPALQKGFGLKKKVKKTYREQIERLTHRLTEASEETDRILQEMSEVSLQRERVVTKLELQLDALTKHEKELQKKIEAMEKVPLPAVEYFANIVEKGEKKSAWRDYALFGLGVLVSTAVAIILRLFGI